MQNFFEKDDMTRMGKMLFAIATIAVLFLGMKFINEVKTFGSIGTAPTPANTIDVSGSGEAFAIPNVAVTTFSVEAKAATIAQAQATVNKNIGTALAFLKQSGIAEKDIQTANYNAYPEYSYPCDGRTVCPAGTANTPKLVGYNVTQSITVKIRNTENVGTIIDGLGNSGVTSISGPEYSVDEPDVVQAEARKKAIESAEAKAKVLAHDLGVRVVRITHFTENSGGYPSPMYAKAEMSAVGGAMDAQLPAGQSKFSSNVTITYEIR